MAISLGVSNVTAEADILVDYNSKNLANEEIVLLNFTDNTDINLKINAEGFSYFTSVINSDTLNSHPINSPSLFHAGNAVLVSDSISISIT